MFFKRFSLESIAIIHYFKVAWEATIIVYPITLAPISEMGILNSFVLLFLVWLQIVDDNDRWQKYVRFNDLIFKIYLLKDKLIEGKWIQDYKKLLIEGEEIFKMMNLSFY